MHVKHHGMGAEFGAVLCTHNSETLGRRGRKEKEKGKEKEERPSFQVPINGWDFCLTLSCPFPLQEFRESKHADR